MAVCIESQRQAEFFDDCLPGGLPEKRIKKRKYRPPKTHITVLRELRALFFCVLSGRASWKLSDQAVYELVGTSTAGLRAYIESLFVPGMSWDNRSKWHVDHIRPCCSFDLTDPIQRKQCFHYTNLQPLWAEDNRRKGGKYEPVSEISTDDV